jgi:ELWxxDGT repeat protein
LQQLEEPRLLAIDLQLMRDINDVSDARGNEPSNFVSVGLITFFTASTTDAGAKLWRIDGTSEGMKLVKDIEDGVAASNPRDLVNVGGSLFFRAVDHRGFELWKLQARRATRSESRTCSRRS